MDKVIKLNMAIEQELKNTSSSKKFQTLLEKI